MFNLYSLEEYMHTQFKLANFAVANFRCNSHYAKSWSTMPGNNGRITMNPRSEDMHLISTQSSLAQVAMLAKYVKA